MITNRNTVPPLSEATVITERLSQIPSEKNVDIILLPNCGGVYYIYVVHLEQQQAAGISLM